MTEEQKQQLIAKVEQQIGLAKTTHAISQKTLEATRTSSNQEGNSLVSAASNSDLVLGKMLDSVRTILDHLRSIPAENLKYEAFAELLQDDELDSITKGGQWHDDMIRTHGLKKMEQIWLQVTGELFGNKEFKEALNRAASNIIGDQTKPEGNSTSIWSIGGTES